MGYVHRGPSAVERRMFLLGIIFGAVLGVLGNILVTLFYRAIDKPSYWNSGFFIFMFVFFFVCLYLFLRIAERTTKQN